MAIKFEKIKEGMILYDVRKSKRFSGRKFDVWPVYIRRVGTDSEGRRGVWASWNGNKEVWMTENRVTRYRAEDPKK